MVPTSQAERKTRLAVDGFRGRDDGKLTEVRWASLAEAGELMSDMAAAVLEHLRRALSGERPVGEILLEYLRVALWLR